MNWDKKNIRIGKSGELAYPVKSSRVRTLIFFIFNPYVHVRKSTIIKLNSETFRSVYGSIHARKGTPNNKSFIWHSLLWGLQGWRKCNHFLATSHLISSHHHQLSKGEHLMKVACSANISSACKFYNPAGQTKP